VNTANERKTSLVATGERLLVAATLEPVLEGQEFELIPSHMTVIGWLAIQASQQHRLYSALDRIFSDDYYQDVVGAKKDYFGPNEDVPVRTLRNVEKAPWVGLHALAKSLRGLPENDQFKDVFSPHVSDMPKRTVKRGEHLSLSTVAVFSHIQGELFNRVEEVYPLGSQRQAQ